MNLLSHFKGQSPDIRTPPPCAVAGTLAIGEGPQPHRGEEWEPGPNVNVEASQQVAKSRHQAGIGTRHLSLTRHRKWREPQRRKALFSVPNPTVWWLPTKQVAPQLGTLGLQACGSVRPTSQSPPCGARGCLVVTLWAPWPPWLPPYPLQKLLSIRGRYPCSKDTQRSPRTTADCFP